MIEVEKEDEDQEWSWHVFPYTGVRVRVRVRVSWGWRSIEVNELHGFSNALDLQTCSSGGASSTVAPFEISDADACQLFRQRQCTCPFCLTIKGPAATKLEVNFMMHSHNASHYINVCLSAAEGDELYLQNKTEEFHLSYWYCHFKLVQNY